MLRRQQGFCLGAITCLKDLWGWLQLSEQQGHPFAEHGVVFDQKNSLQQVTFLLAQP